MNDNAQPLFGATLYVPALHPALYETAAGAVADLGAMVICLEDSIRDDQVGQAMDALEDHLARRDPRQGPTAYVRPRTPEMARRIAAMRHVEGIRGFVVPKATADNLPAWLSAIGTGGHAIMPTLETAHAFDFREVQRLRDQCLASGAPVDMVRIGGNDLLSTIAARRSGVDTLYEGPIGPVVSLVVGAFAGSGIGLSSPVLEHYADDRLLERELRQDIDHGIVNKTAIHPRQVPLINRAFQPTAEELAEARAILADDAEAVFGRRGSMCEPKTHAAWAERVVSRFRQLGVRAGSDVDVAAA